MGVMTTGGASTGRATGGRRRGKVRGPGPPASSYTLVRGAPRVATAPLLDPEQQQVVGHRGGPLLVLAGPGTGKTTTIVEAVVSRIERGLDPEQILVLTFARKAAAELRERITARLARATKEPLARTFHSYAFGVLRREAAMRGDPTPRLLSGPEQDVVIRDLLAGDIADGSRAWPVRLRPALGTRGFAQELRDLIMRAYERGLTPNDLNRLGREHQRDDWRAAARFMRQYGEVTALREAAAYDPAELIRAVVSLWIGDRALLARERAARQVIFVDELQDTDPAQVELLRLLAGGGRDLVAVGDPDQSIYGFRGADVSGIEGFPETFRTATGEPARVVALHTSRRSGPVLLAATRRVASRLAAPGDHRSLQPGADLTPGEVSVALLRSESREGAYIAARLREAHLVDGVPWRQMAVLVRSTVVSMPVLRRALGAAGVPVAVAAGEVPLASQPAVRPLLTLLSCVVDPASLDEQQAVELLTSALGGADVIGLRRLRQALRRAELDADGGRPSGPLLVEAITDPRALINVEPGAARPAERVARLLQAATEEHAREGASVEDVLWAAWSASGLSKPLGARQPRGWSGGRRRRPRPRRRGGAVRDGRAVLRPAARCRFRGVPRPPHGSGDPRRLARGSGAHRRRGRGAHRPRQQGARVGPGLRRRRPGGGLALVAVARLVPRHRAPGRPAASRRRVAARRGRRGDNADPAARRGAAAVLRRRDASASPPARDGGDQRA